MLSLHHLFRCEVPRKDGVFMHTGMKGRATGYGKERGYENAGELLAKPQTTSQELRMSGVANCLCSSIQNGIENCLVRLCSRLWFTEVVPSCTRAILHNGDENVRCNTLWRIVFIGHFFLLEDGMSLHTRA